MHTNDSITPSQPSLPAWFNRAVWWAALLSPTAYFLLLLVADRLQISSHVATCIWSLLCVVPVVALVFCESVAWMRNRTVLGKIGWMLFTLAAMLLQLGIILVVLRAILVTRIAYPQ
jgi:hypothetical protein